MRHTCRLHKNHRNSLLEIKPSSKDPKPLFGDPENISLLYCSCGQDFDERQYLDVHKQKCPTIQNIQKEEDVKEPTKVFHASMSSVKPHQGKAFR